MIYTVTLNPVLDRTLSVPGIAFNEVLRASALRLDWGGKGFNVSRALHALGGESIALGFCGGVTGQLLERGLNGLGIRTELTPISGETRTNIVIAEEGSGRYIKVNEAGPQILAAEREAFLEKVRRITRAGDLWVLSGSLPPGLPSDFYARLVSLVQSGGGRAFLDTSGEPLRLGCAAAPTLVKPNAAEAAEVSGIPVGSGSEARRAAGFFLRQGVTWVALSLGEAGLLMAGEGLETVARPPRLSAGHPTGAGDACLAGIVWALQQGLSPVEAARWGAATGTAAAAQAGSGVGSFQEVEKLYQQVVVDEL